MRVMSVIIMSDNVITMRLMFGYAHSKCNRERRTLDYLLVLFHNLKGFDAHLIIIKEVVKRCYNVRLISKSTESYSAIITRQFRFNGKVRCQQHKSLEFRKHMTYVDDGIAVNW